MRKTILGFLAAGMLVSATANAEHTRITNPNALGVEGLGRGLTWSAFFDRVVNDDLAGGFGFGTASVSAGSSDETVTIIPLYLNYYLVKDAGSLYVTGGVDVVASDADGGESALGSVNFTSSPVVPLIGIGYENRGDSGFLLRATGYALFADTISPWVGFSFGYAF